MLRPEEPLYDPPAPLVPLPTTIVMYPEVPEVEAPEPTATLPLLPELDDPELKYNEPLTPFVPEFKLRMATTPLLEAVPSPLAKLRSPPEWTVLRPAVIRS
jgi:hypothetical protein